LKNAYKSLREKEKGFFFLFIFIILHMLIYTRTL
jgi:hypothetical protein